MDELLKTEGRPTLEQELTSLLNRYSQENGSNTPDYVLAGYLLMSLKAWHEATKKRDRFYGVRLRPGWRTELVSGITDAIRGTSTVKESGNG